MDLIDMYFMFSIYMFMIICLLSIPTAICLWPYYIYQKNQCNKTNNDPKSDYCIRVDENGRLVDVLKTITTFAGIGVIGISIYFIVNKYSNKKAIN